MSLTLYDIADLLRREDCVTILELLDISSDDLVDRFMDVLEDKADKLEKELG
jgi:Mg2+ and Co2+ transporter CorA|tara:strand:- start:505 stop:660 length:156 start_codon:yes stop_codon:yes gene_type:complete